MNCQCAMTSAGTTPMINLGSQATPQFSLPFTQCIPAVCLHHCRNHPKSNKSVSFHFQTLLLQGDPEPAVLCQHVPPESPVVLGCAGHKTSSDGDTDLNGWEWMEVLDRNLIPYRWGAFGSIHLQCKLHDICIYDHLWYLCQSWTRSCNNIFISQDQLPQEPFTVFIDKPISVLSSESSDEIKPQY